MKYASFLHKLTQKPVAMLPSYHKAILDSAEALVQGCDLEDLFGEDDCEMYQTVGNVDIITISGVILPTACKFEKMLGAVSLKEVRAALKLAQRSPATTLILNINSPGGCSTGLEETAKAIQKVNAVKDTVAYTDGDMCSAAYWLGAQCKTVLSSESANVGSIGVYIALLTIQKSLEMQGITGELIKCGKWKALGIPMKDLTDEERAFLQAEVDDAYEDFKLAVASRGLLDEVMQGQSYEGEDAYTVNLTDGIQNDFDQLVAFLQ